MDIHNTLERYLIKVVLNSDSTSRTVLKAKKYSECTSWSIKHDQWRNYKWYFLCVFMGYSHKHSPVYVFINL